MAEFNFNIDQSFLKSLGRLQDVDRIAPKMIDEALPILEESIKSGLRGVMRNPTGELMNSLKIFTAKQRGRSGFYGYISATGVAKRKVYQRKRKSGTKKAEGYRNYQKILALEYGTSKQKPRPFMEAAVKNSESRVLAKMRQVFEQEMGLK